MFEAFFISGFIACLTLIIMNLCVFWTGRQSIHRRLLELEQIRSVELARQQRIVELSRRNAAHQFELRWISSLSDESGTPRHVMLLLDGAVPAGSKYYAWILNPAGEVVAQNSQAHQSRITLEITKAGKSRLEQQTTPRLSTRRQEFILAPGAPSSSIREIHVFPCGTKRSDGYLLCMSHVPDLSGDAVADRVLLANLSRTLKFESADHSAGANAISEQEIDLIRDMLTLRTLTDSEFDSPHAMLQEFLCRLASLCDFERATIFQVESPEKGTLMRLASGGISVTYEDDLLWKEAERQQLAHRGNSQSELYWTDHSGTCQTGSLRLQTCLIADRCESRESGAGDIVVILSNRSKVTHSSLKEDLVRWAAGFVPHTFRKAVLREQIEERARYDGLTRVANRQTFDAEIEKRFRASHGADFTCSLLLIDIDHFKLVNDTYGHQVGDEVIKSVATTISHVVRQIRSNDSSLVARYGGEEFAVLLPEVGLAGAERIAEEIRCALELRRQKYDNGHFGITGSIGVATRQETDLHPEMMIKAADIALYAAKNGGRNCVVVAPDQNSSDDKKQVLLNIPNEFAS
ncbi:GGDEF domain-containing protein [Planctomicrobium sp. SH668]|uniref:sensor domain-containing diguanylate cyclase n=1 Tax=Planctomicrobium sp. SH668 TaxID=3448126 RepID=UPI003F5C5D65